VSRSSIEVLLENYERHLTIPWSVSASGTERVWYLVYPPEEERRLRRHLAAFRDASHNAGYEWIEHDLAPAFSRWFAEQPRRDRVLSKPGDRLPQMISGFERELQREVRGLLTATRDPTGIVALVGLGGLYGLSSVSRLVNAVADDVAGRLVGFFPGRFDGNAYHLLNGDGDWNYMAVPVTSDPERRT
jgi:hypothetical protein